MKAETFIKEHPMDLPGAIYWQKERKIKVSPCHSNRASELGHECLRYLVLNRTRWQDRKPHDVRLQLIFDEGNNQEDTVIRDLMDAGIKVTEQQKAFMYKEHQITGHLDLMVESNGFKGPIEIKSMNPHIFDAINSLEDFKKYPWTARYIAQMQIYLLMNDSEKGFFLLKNKSTGELKQIEINLDYEYAEGLLQKAGAINQHVADETLPDHIKNPDACKSCAFFGHVCNPPLEFDAPVISDDPELVEMLDRRAELEPGKKEYDALDKKVKARFKDEQNVGKQYVAGRHLISISSQHRKSYSVAESDCIIVKIKSEV